jgi:hypothetical protein
MIFRNPRGGPELGCDECGCRWFDRHTNACYECGTAVPPEEILAYQKAVSAFHAEKGITVNAPAAQTL